MFGTHDAIIGLTSPLMANDEVMVINKIYEKLSPRPIPIFSPIPPFFLYDAKEKPITVRMKNENALAKRL